VRVFGLDPVREPVAVLSRLGYLSEDRDLPEWMTVGELVTYLAAFYPSWDDALADELRRRFGLDAAAKIKNLSQGQRARTGLLAALAYRPELLVLDEPSTGQDPVVRREILGAIIRTIAEEGRTVVFSSHLLDEIERVCDHVAMIDRGKVVLFGPLDEVKEGHRRVTFRFDAPLDAAPPIYGALRCDGADREWTAVCRGPVDSVAADAAEFGARVVEERTPTLDEIFVAHVSAGRLAAEVAR
jgi:ABC-2 type transport system ATP-binding protein